MFGEPAHTLRTPEHEKTVRVQCEMKDGDQSLLQNRAQVDQQIPATDQVDAGERRVLHRVLLRKEADLVDGLRDLIASAIEFDEEVFQPLGRNICGDRLWKHAGAS